MHRLFLLALLIAQVTPQCGGSTSGGGSTIAPSPATPVNNTLAVTVSAGPNNDYINGLFTSVQVCVPGSSSCQTIGNVLVDTGSVGLRLVSSVLTLSLPQQTTSGGAPIVECAQFQDGFTWGPLRTADVLLGSKKATNVPIQVIGESAFEGRIPQQCSSTGSAEDTVADLSANGILGVGQYNEDCGGSCERLTSTNPGFYYACPSSGCTLTAVSSAVQARNPVSMFSSDNNGIVIQLPSVPPGGTTSVNGTMYFGIGTQSNNQLGSAKVMTTNAQGNFTTIYNGQSYTDTFIDSGSNGNFFLDTATTGIPTCTQVTDFYCPRTTQTLSATHKGINGVTFAFQFNVGNADAIPARFAAAAELAGPNSGTFDWGLSFFFGRTIFIAIEGQGAPGGTAPYWAY